MDRLTTESYWNAKYDDSETPARQPSHIWSSRIKRLLGPRVVSRMHNYADRMLWDVILPAHLPPGAGRRAIEIGSAPGIQLVRMHRRFGYEVYGVEYTEAGVAANRRVFAEAGLDPDHVFHRDFFSDQFHEEHRESFDLVMSRGFIEHFDDVADVVRRHFELAKPGGCVFVVIPNLRGVNYALTWLFHRELIPMHNLEIMDLAVFRALFQQLGQSQVCRYYGTFSFSAFNTKPDSMMRRVLNGCQRLQMPLNLLFGMLMGDRGLEHRNVSPYLVYLGIKE